MSQKGFLFDSDSLIVAKDIHYSPRFCPTFWNWVLEGNKHKILFTIDRIADEIKLGHENDFLRKFVEIHQDDFVLATKNEIKCLGKYAEIQNWANTKWSKGKNQRKTVKALEVFAEEKTADPWLVAYASVNGYSIISNEKSAPECQTIVKLPDVTSAFGVKFMKLHEVLSIHSGENFVFKKK